MKAHLLHLCYERIQGRHAEEKLNRFTFSRPQQIHYFIVYTQTLLTHSLIKQNYVNKYIYKYAENSRDSLFACLKISCFKSIIKQLLLLRALLV